MTTLTLGRDRFDKARHSRDVPKAQRRRSVAPSPAMTDPQATLGHPPRPRKRR